MQQVELDFKCAASTAAAAVSASHARHIVSEPNLRSLSAQMKQEFHYQQQQQQQQPGSLSYAGELKAASCVAPLESLALFQLQEQQYDASSLALIVHCHMSLRLTGTFARAVLQYAARHDALR